MNATFNIRRFGLNIYKELLEKYKTIIGFWAVIMLIHLAIWGFAILFRGDFGPDGRATLVLGLLQIYCCLLPFILYKNENRHVEGVFYGIAPASTLEKTLTIFVIVTLIFPILTTVLLLSFDSLLSSVMSINTGFSGHLWDNIFSGDRYMYGLLNSQTPEGRAFLDQAIDAIPSIYFTPFLSILLGQCCFVFMAMLFRTHKIWKTLLVFCAVGFLFSVAISVSVVSVVNALDAADLTYEATERLMNWFKNLFKLMIIITFYVQPVVFWVLTYFRIRRIQY